MPTTKQVKMTSEEFGELRAAVATVSAQDVHLGRVLDLFVLHLGHANGLDVTAEDARLAAEARQKSRDEEDVQLAADAEALKNQRASEDTTPHTPEQQAALEQTRANEDAQIKADADARQKRRDEEDAAAREQAAQEGA